MPVRLPQTQAGAGKSKREDAEVVVRSSEQFESSDAVSSSSLTVDYHDYHFVGSCCKALCRKYKDPTKNLVLVVEGKAAASRVRLRQLLVDLFVEGAVVSVAVEGNPVRYKDLPPALTPPNELLSTPRESKYPIFKNSGLKNPYCSNGFCEQRP